MFSVDDPPKPQYKNPAKYDIDDVVNFYISTLDLNNKTVTSIGAWMILHENEPHPIRDHDIATATEILRQTTKPILFFLHGVACNRVKAIQPYKQLRKHFLIISVDHRGKLHMRTLVINDF